MAMTNENSPSRDFESCWLLCVGIDERAAAKPYGRLPRLGPGDDGRFRSQGRDIAACSDLGHPVIQGVRNFARIRKPRPGPFSGFQLSGGRRLTGAFLTSVFPVG